MNSSLEHLQHKGAAHLRTRNFIAQAKAGGIDVLTQGISDLEKTIEEKSLKRSGLFALFHYPVPTSIQAESGDVIADVSVQISIYEQPKSNISGLGCLGLAEKIAGALHWWEIPGWDGSVLSLRPNNFIEILPSLPGFNKLAVHLVAPAVRLYSENNVH